jgi:hypothetical protein
MMAQKKKPKSSGDQSARFLEAAKKAGADDAEGFERAFKKVVPAKRSKARKQPQP